MANLFECYGFSPQQHFLVQSPVDLNSGINTFYDLQLVSHDPMLLGSCDDTQIYPKKVAEPFRKIAIFDVCSGIGGFSLGTQPFDIETIAFLDSNWLACETLRANFTAPVIHGELGDLKCMKELHALCPDAFIQVTGGFPCQPYSFQGDLQGLGDQRGAVLPSRQTPSYSNA